jgi:hypothetical protein
MFCKAYPSVSAFFMPPIGLPEASLPPGRYAVALLEIPGEVTPDFRSGD